MECGVISFGKHRGLPACDVPLDYLVWATETMARPPECVMEELRRRASLYGTREALEAQSVLNGYGHRVAKRGRKVAARSAARPSRHKTSAEIIGREIAAGREAWLAAGGDVSESPF